MSHPEQVEFFRRVAEANRPLITDARIFEIGSYDVNGTIRDIFAGSREYVGVDLTPGPGVDHVGYGHEFDAPDASFDLAISGECFEHDPMWRESFGTMARVTRPGGLVMFSCASRGRPEHGTQRTDSTLSPGTQAVGLDYYRNLVEADFAELPLDQWFDQWRFWYIPTNFDLYFAGVRSGGDEGTRAVLPDHDAVQAIADMMPTVHRLARLPLKTLARTGISEQKYQNRILRYWKLLLRIAGDRACRS